MGGASPDDQTDYSIHTCLISQIPTERLLYREGAYAWFIRGFQQTSKYNTTRYIYRIQFQ